MASTVRPSVRDRGIGTPRDEPPRVFDRFYQARNVGSAPWKRSGTGRARHIAERHGGRIRVERQECQRGAFEVDLPIDA
jgi:signal transduction histidine kinase